MKAKALATEIVQKFANEGYIAYFAGGWVRDYLLDHPSSDIDIATNAPPQVILDLFPQTILVGLSFGVVIVVLDGHQFEVATFRKDIGYVGGRRPTQIEMSDAREDAIRRDFTINGMFYDPLEDVVHDYVGGTEDLKMGIIRCIGNANERFVEDRLRMVRAVRFACRFGFAVDADTQEAIAENAETLFPAVAMERIWQEFNKMAESPRFDQALVMMYRLGLLAVIFPILKGVHLNDIKHRVASFAHFPEKSPTILYLMSLFPDSSLEEKVGIGRMLHISGKDIALIELMDRYKRLAESENSANLVEWVHFYATPNSHLILDCFAASLPNDQRLAFLEKFKLHKESVQLHVDRVKEKKPLVTSALLKEHGIPEGRVMGTLLKKAESIAVYENLDNTLIVLNKLKNSPEWPGKE